MQFQRKFFRPKMPTSCHDDVILFETHIILVGGEGSEQNMTAAENKSATPMKPLRKH